MWISGVQRHYRGEFISMYRIEICGTKLGYGKEINEWFRIAIDGRKPTMMYDPNTINLVIEFEHKRDAVAFCVLFGRIRQLRIKKFYEFSFEDRSTFCQ